MNVLNPENSLLLIIDVQERLVNALDKNIIVKRVSNLVKSAALLSIPVVVTEKDLEQQLLKWHQNFRKIRRFLKKQPLMLWKQKECLIK